MEKTSGMNIIPISINVPNQVVGLTKQSFFSLPPVSIIITWASPLKRESLFSPFCGELNERFGSLRNQNKWPSKLEISKRLPVKSIAVLGDDIC